MCLSSLERGVDPPEQELKVIVSYPVWVLRISPSHLQEWYALSTTELSPAPTSHNLWMSYNYNGKAWKVLSNSAEMGQAQPRWFWVPCCLWDNETLPIHWISPNTPHGSVPHKHGFYISLHQDTTVTKLRYVRVSQDSNISLLTQVTWTEELKTTEGFFFPYSSRSWEVQD